MDENVGQDRLWKIYYAARLAEVEIEHTDTRSSTLISPTGQKVICHYLPGQHHPSSIVIAGDGGLFKVEVVGGLWRRVAATSV